MGAVPKSERALEWIAEEVAGEVSNICVQHLRVRTSRASIQVQHGHARPPSCSRARRFQRTLHHWVRHRRRSARPSCARCLRKKHHLRGGGGGAFVQCRRPRPRRRPRDRDRTGAALALAHKPVTTCASKPFAACDWLHSARRRCRCRSNTRGAHPHMHSGVGHVMPLSFVPILSELRCCAAFRLRFHSFRTGAVVVTARSQSAHHCTVALSLTSCTQST